MLIAISDGYRHLHKPTPLGQTHRSILGICAEQMEFKHPFTTDFTVVTKHLTAKLDTPKHPHLTAKLDTPKHPPAGTALTSRYTWQVQLPLLVILILGFQS